MTTKQLPRQVVDPHHRKGRLRRSLMVAVLAVAAMLTAVPPQSAEAADTLFGHDVSWPQCASAQGGYALPLPPSSSDFTIIGLTRGLAFTENPCLGTQVSWAVSNDVPTHAYTMATFPTQAQLSTHGATGPYASGSRAGQLANVGYAEAQYALASLARVGWTPPVVWVDVEPRAAQAWPGSTAAQKVENRYVIQGLLRGLREAGVGAGLYSYTAGWNEIVGAWSLPGVPVWATAGSLDYPEEAADRCTQASFSGGPVYLSQWTDGTRDYNRTCGTYEFRDLPRNLVGVPGVTITASSVDTDVSPSTSSVADGMALGYPTELSMEWSSAQQTSGAWVQLQWPSPVTLDRIVLYDRPNADDQALTGTLSFSDGTSVPVGALPNDGAALKVSFAKRAVTSVRFTVNSASATTWAAGLAEIEAWGTVGGTPKPTTPPTTPPTGTNVARASGVGVTASSQDSGTGQTAAKAVDGSATGYPTDSSKEWATVGGGAGSWLQLSWSSPVSLNRVVLYDRPNTADQITGGTLAFSDGSTVSVPSLNNAGGATTVTFTARATTSLRLTVTSASGTTENVGLAELEAWGSATSGSNRAPVAEAGSAQTVTTGTTVTMNGSGTDPDPGTALTYRWTRTSGPLATPSPADRPQTSFVPTIAGIYVFALTVSDGALSATDSVTITAVAPPSGSGTNVARATGVVVTASSQDSGTGQTAAKAVDGSAIGYPTDSTREWATVGGASGSWLQLNWPTPVSLSRVVLYDRPNTADQITGGTLTFSDGSTVSVPSLNNAGGATTVTFTGRTTTSLRLTVTGASGTTENVGLAELEAWGATATESNVARASGVGVTASSQDSGTGQTAAKAVDGSASGYPADSSKEWATVGGSAGSWLQLNWSGPVSLSRVVLYDRPNTDDQVTGGTLTFSDGSTVSVPSLDNAGGATTVTFPSRTVTSVRLTVNAVASTTANVGLAEFQAWGSA